MRKLIVLPVVAFVLTGGLAHPLLAEPAPSAKTAAPGSRPAEGGNGKAEDVLRRMADYLGNLPAFSCTVDSSLEVKAKEVNDNMKQKTVVRLKRPNRLFVASDGDAGVTIVSNSKQFVQLITGLNRYVVSDPLPNLGELSKLEEPNAFTILQSPPLPTSGDEFYKALMAKVTKSEYLGTQKVDGVECHHCRFIQETIDWDIWISTGEKPLIQKFAPDYAKWLTNSGRSLGDAKITFTVLFGNWNTAPKFSDADFAFTAPAGAEKVDSFMEAIESQNQEGPHPLLGQPAPVFQTKELNGHPFDLKKYVGKNVVLLDFWATWCGPCVEALPKVDAAAKKFAEKGLVFRAVNVGEDDKTIKEFLESAKLDANVVLDAQHEIAQAYMVNGIPQTVLIGKDGKVQVVHVGAGPNIGDMLSDEITDLLAGKDLAGPKLKKAEEARKKHAAKSKTEPPADNPQAN